MDHEITHLLAEWPFEPDQLNVREVTATDGRRLIQVRVELGLLQFETAGRPDGVRPNDHLTLLEALDKARVQHEAITGAEPFRLDESMAAALRDEAAIFHQRYVAYLSLEDFDEVVRDTTHSLEIFSFCNTYGLTDQDRDALEPLRPRVVATRARAQAASLIRDGQAKAAMDAISAAVDELCELGSDLPEIALLEGMRDVLIPKLPSSQRHELEQRLSAAIAAENYELAALLRDELRMMK